MSIRDEVARALCRQNGLCVGFCHRERCASAIEQYGEQADAILPLIEANAAAQVAAAVTIAREMAEARVNAADNYKAMRGTDDEWGMGYAIGLSEFADRVEQAAIRAQKEAP